MEILAVQVHPSNQHWVSGGCAESVLAGDGGQRRRRLALQTEGVDKGAAGRRVAERVDVSHTHVEVEAARLFKAGVHVGGVVVGVGGKAHAREHSRLEGQDNAGCSESHV